MKNINILERVFKNWKSSLVGVAIILFFGGMIWQEKVDVTTGLLAMSSAIYFFYIKDDDSPLSGAAS